MTIWKKAISAVTSAALLASLLATAVAPAVGAAGHDDTAYLDCAVAASLTDCSQIADGISTITLKATADPVLSSLYITATGAAVIAATPDFVLAGGIVTAIDGADLIGLPTSTITFRAPAVAGTAVVSVYEISTATGISTLEGTFTMTFTATSGVAVSEANSTVKFVAVDAFCGVDAAPAGAPKGLNPAAKLCVLVKNVNGAPVTTASVTAQIQPVGLISVGSADAGLGTSPAGTAQVATTGINDEPGWYAFGIGGSGLAGVGTVGVSVKLSGVTTTFAPKTFTFSDTLASITVTPVTTVIGLGSEVKPAIRYGGKDAAGNAVAIVVDEVAPTFDNAVVTGTVGTVSNMTSSSATLTPDGQVWVKCGLTAGSITLAVKSGSITSAATTILCSDVPDTFTAVFGATVVAAGGSTTLTVKALDANGKPAAPKNVQVVVSSGAISPLNKDLVNGEAVFTYLAPFNFGTVTALVTVTGITASKSASINIGVPAVVTTLGSTASTLGVAPPGGSWSTSTKVAKLGSFITWRFAAGVANAGKTIGVFLQTRDANGVWSAPVRFSARVADSSGNAYFSWRSSSALWVSIRGGLGDARSNPPVQGRWR